LSPLLLAFFVGAASAGPVEAAEHRRISDEMKAAMARNTWSAVDEHYRKLVELEARGEPLTVEDHWIGAQAARSLGDLRTCRERLDLAARAGGSRDVIGWIEEIDAGWGPLRVTVDATWAGDRTLVPAEPGFAPDQRAAVARATALLAGGSFEGLVPVGSYSVGGQSVTVTTGERVAALAIVGPPPSEVREGPYRLAYAGPRASIGVAYTRGGTLGEAGSSADAGLQAASFEGSGARLGVGLEVGLTRNVGLLAEVGYHNLFGPPTVDGERLEDADTYLVAGNSLHLGYGWLAGSLRAGPVSFAIGPVWSAGGGVVTGVDGYCVSDGSGEQMAPCGEDYPYLREDSAAGQRLAGRVTAGGGAAAIGFSFVDIGPLRGGVALEGGLQTDTFRLYPWGQLAFTVAPAAPRGKG